MPTKKQIHEEILKELLTNLDKHTTINSISDATGYNWRTVKNQIKNISNQFKNTYDVIKGEE